MPTNIPVGASLLTLALLMNYRHVAVWKAARDQPADAPQQRYLWRQCRRRVLASSLIGMVGVAVMLGTWLTGTIAAAVYWSAVVSVVIWTVYLAVADVRDSQRYFAREKQGQREEYEALRSEMKQISRQAFHRRNGD